MDLQMLGRSRKGRYHKCYRRNQQDLGTLCIHGMRKNKIWICSQLLSFCHTQEIAISQRPYYIFFSHMWVYKTGGIFIQFFYFWCLHFQKYLSIQIFEGVKQFSFDFFKVISPFTVPLIYILQSLFKFFFLSFLWAVCLHFKEIGSWDTRDHYSS